MANYARVVNDVAVDVSTDPANHFHPEVAAQFSPVPDAVRAGWVFVNAAWQAPAVVTPPTPPVVLAKLSPMAFYLAFKPAERIAIKGSTDPVVQEFWATYQIAKDLGSEIDPALTSVVQGLQYLASHPTGTPILASTDRIAQIQAGTAQ